MSSHFGWLGALVVAVRRSGRYFAFISPVDRPEYETAFTETEGATMLQLTGKTLGVTSETRQGPTGSFVATTIHVLSGMESQAVSVSRDFPPSDLPKEGEEVCLNVAVSAFARRAGGAGVQITALSRHRTGQRVSAVS